jgi:hypothetical protein
MSFDETPNRPRWRSGNRYHAVHASSAHAPEDYVRGEIRHGYFKITANGTSVDNIITRRPCSLWNDGDWRIMMCTR